MQMVQQVHKCLPPSEGAGVTLGLVTLGSFWRQLLGVWLCKQLCGCLAKVVDNGLDLMTFLLILDAVQVDIV